MNEINFIDDNELVMLDNLTNHDVGYTLESSNVKRMITPGTHIRIPVGEVRELAASYGGKVMLQNYIRINNKELAKEIGIPDDCVEYWWTREDIEKALTTSDMDVLLDALDFAPDGIKEQLRYLAVEEEISDNNRLKAIGEAFGVDLFSMIRNKHVYDAVDDTKKVKATHRRHNGEAVEAPHRRCATK